MELSDRMFKHISALMVMNGKVGLEVATEWAEEVAQLEVKNGRLLSYEAEVKSLSTVMYDYTMRRLAAQASEVSDV